jgi:hypothetical protein
VKRIAIVTLLAFGCATVRVPIAPLGEPEDASGTVAPPLTELWLESSEEVPPELARKADAQARAALASALAGREIAARAAGAADAVLFVRERAVGLTGARRSQQTWARVGIVAGVVVVIAAAVFALTRGGQSSSPSARTPNAATPVKARAVPVSPAVPVGHAVPLRPVPVYRPSPVFVGFSVNFWIAPQPMVLAPDPAEEEWYGPLPPPPLEVEEGTDAPPADSLALADAPPAPDPQPEPPAPSLELPPLQEPLTFRVEDRGFFAGPVTALQLDLLDRATGRTLWSRAIRTDADPLDAAAVAKVLDEALAGQDWARARR